MKSKVVIKSSKSGMTVILDPECTFEELLAEVSMKFRESSRFWGNVQMALLLEGRELTAEEEFRIVNTITENSGIEVLCLIDNDLNRIERCEKALNQKLMELSSRTGQFYRGDLHRGESLESEASIVIIGDVRHGARVTAKGNIIVLGELRGSVHAGVAGDRDAVVAAMEMAPLQIKIADIMQHYGDKGRRLGKGPMIANVENCSICTKAIKKSVFSMLNFN
ncbi:septum site-determining protein MinC [Clostridium sp. AN503]|uniref:septum site-determining protein MinC n=1 Tax=Clostridium sp. AN503 TaxID=3160598 RepID=UPI00345B4A8E